MSVYPGVSGGQGPVCHPLSPTREGLDRQTTSQLSLLPTVHAAGLCRDPMGLA